MRKIVISTNVSLDGVVQDPDGQEAGVAGAPAGCLGRASSAGLKMRL